MQLSSRPAFRKGEMLKGRPSLLSARGYGDPHRSMKFVPNAPSEISTQNEELAILRPWSNLNSKPQDSLIANARSKLRRGSGNNPAHLGTCVLWCVPNLARQSYAVDFISGGLSSRAARPAILHFF